MIIKARAADDRPDEKTAWAATALPLLAARGYPVPEILWHGLLDGNWHVAVLRRLRGRPVDVLSDEVLARVLDLVELQADAGIEPGVRDMAAYNALVVFDGWDCFRRDAEAAAPALVERLDGFLQPVWGRRLEARDFAHGDLNLTNVLTDRRRITGVVDWDEVGLNSRAADLTSILFDWHALALRGTPGLAGAAAPCCGTGSSRSRVTTACGARSGTQRSAGSGRPIAALSVRRYARGCA